MIEYIACGLIGAGIMNAIMVNVWLYCLQKQHDIDHERMKRNEQYTDTQIMTLSGMIQEVDEFLKQTRREMRP